MEIIINGQQAVLKKNTSFEYISENSMFTGSDSYTLAITFPLKDCPQNIAIFGHIHRQDVEKSKVVFDCDIRDKAFFRSGSIIITNISEVEVKTQFLEGRSEQNFDDTFDDIYLNQLKLGYPTQLNPNNIDPYSAWHVDVNNPTYVALPWVNNTTGNLQNGAKFNSENNTYSWLSPGTNLSYMPYLNYLLKKICEAVGYSYDFTALGDFRYRYLLVCNVLPGAWNIHNFAVALPHWTLTEFFEQLEMFLAGEFVINHKAKTIKFQFIKTIAENVQEVKIEHVVNKYTVEVAKEAQNDYLGRKNLVYAENDNRYWSYRDCQWYIDEHKNEAVVYDSFFTLRDYAQTLAISGYERHERTDRQGNVTGHSEAFYRGYGRRKPEGHKLYYARDVDTYFIMWFWKAEFIMEDRQGNKWYKYYNRLEPINQFGRYEMDREAEDIELKCVPAWIDDTDDELGPCVFLECGEMGSAVSWTEESDTEGNSTGSSSSGSATVVGNRSQNGSTSGWTFGGSRSGSYIAEVDDTDYDSGALAQPDSVRAIAKGRVDKNDAYFDCLYLGYHDIEARQYGYLPHPCIDELQRERGFYFTFSYYSMRLKDISLAQSGLIKNIDPKKKYNFSFLSDEIPDPRAIFYIEGGKYICEKITATFHEGESGMSQLKRGVFYRVI